MSSPNPALVDGVDIDVLAAAVRNCPSVDDLESGRPGSVATYLPGRRVPGLRVEHDRVTIAVRGMWNIPVGDVAAEIRAAVASLVGQRAIDVVVADLADPQVG